MTLTRKQLLAMAAIIAAGLLLAALILRGAPHDDTHPDHGQEERHQTETPASQEKEGHLRLTAQQSRAAGIVIAAAAPARIAASLALPGEIRFNEDRTAHVVPRLAGVVEAVHADLGQQVKRGQVLAVIASSELSEYRSALLSAQRRLALAQATYEREQALWQEKISAEQDYLQAQQTWREADIAVHNAQQKLQALGARAAGKGALNRYEIRAPFDAMVLEKHITLGEAVKEDANIFVLSDLSTVWAEVDVPAKDLARVRVGGTVAVKATAFEAVASGRISYVGALLGEQTRTAKARITLANPGMAWRPGLFVSVEVAGGELAAPIAVQSGAIETVENQAVVFVQVKDGYQATPVTLGPSDGRHTQVTQGLAAGTPYAAQGSFVLKSELGKAEAGHAH